MEKILLPADVVKILCLTTTTVESNTTWINARRVAWASISEDADVINLINARRNLLVLSIGRQLVWKDLIGFTTKHKSFKMTR